MIRVKICGITRLVDALVAIEAGADAIGMVFAPSLRQIKLAQAKRIIDRIPATVLRVGVFVDQDPEWINQIAWELGLDRLQLHGQESAAVMRQFPGSRVWRALRPAWDAALPKKDPAPQAAAVLIDAWVPGQPGGTGKVARWDWAQAVKTIGKPLILAGGLNERNVGQAISQVRPDMVDVSSGVEVRPGVKDAKKIRAFIRKVKKL